MKKLLFPLLSLLVVGWIGWQIHIRLKDETDPNAKQGNSRSRVVPVEVEPVTRGTIEYIRSFTGTLNASEEFVVSPNVSGRIETIAVELADMVNRGQVVVALDNAEYQQALKQAQADLAVARANLGEAESLLEIAGRELSRMETLGKRGVSSDTERDTVKASHLARAAHLEVSRAQVTKASAAVETARIRLDYSNVTANWAGGSDQRIVAERYVNEGQTVAANEPLLRIVELDQVIAVFHVTERDYGLLETGQVVQLSTDAYPGEKFEGRIDRIAPVFRQSTRQARVELRIDNPGHRLKPGMFARIEVRLALQTDALIIPQQALVVRNGQSGVFRLTDDEASVVWHPVETGIRQGSNVQLINGGLTQDVVVLGQQLLDDGSAVRVTGKGAP